MSQLDRSSELALLLTFLNDNEVRELATQIEFQEHAVSQKRLIADLLKNGFALKTNVNPQTRETQTKLVSAKSAEASVSVYKPAPKTENVTQPAPVQSESAPTKSSLDSDSVRNEITKIFAEKTGYPVDMLEPKLDLEADLGIDTVKQMEILGMVRKKFSIKLREGFSLKQTPTIEAIVNLVLQG